MSTKAASKSIDIPDDLQQALRKNKSAEKAFLALPPSHQREYLKWIAEAKRDETRAKRIQATIEKVASKSA